jgi:ElaA protein
MPKIETEWQRFEDLTGRQLYELLRFRQGIFVVEQRSPYPDLDGLDQGAWHLSARTEGELCAYLRLIPKTAVAKAVRIGRLAVAAPRRRQGVGAMLMREARLFCRERHPRQPIALSAQLYLVPFYRRFGFAAVSDPYDDFGVAHIDMLLQPGD